MAALSLNDSFNFGIVYTTGSAVVPKDIGVGFQLGTQTRWQLVTNDGAGAPTLT